jgi:hypothetical protein
MNPLVDRVLSEIEQLSLAEQMQVLEHLVKQMKQSVESVAVAHKPKKKFKVSDFRGIAPNLLEGMDAQEWVNQLRKEWDDREAWRQPQDE